MRRLFVAAWPPDDVLDVVGRLDRPPVAGVHWTTRDQWHVTVRFLGSVPDAGPVVDALACVVLAGPVRATLGPEVGRFGRRILHVPVAGLEALAAAVIGATAGLGKPPEDRPFHGHLTLARVAKDARTDLRALTGTPVEGGWDVDAVCLVESRLSAARARYEVLERFPLAGGPTPAAT